MLNPMHRRRASSELDVSQPSSFLRESLLNLPVPEGRASEQLPRRPSPTDVLALPSEKDENSACDGPADQRSTRPVSPAIQEANPKHRRFSMLRFRHASDPQLSTKARLHAQAESTPKVPQRQCSSIFSFRTRLTGKNQRPK
jgi:hypothetical protein